MIRILIWSTSLLLCMLGCTGGDTNQQPEESTDLRAQHQGDKAVAQVQEASSTQPKLDTFYIDLDSLRQLDQKRNYDKLTGQPLMDSLVSWGYDNSRTQFLDSDQLYGHYKNYGRFYKNTLPRSIYLRIFPFDDNRIEIRHITRGAKMEVVDGKVLSYYGKQIREERKFGVLYSVIEREGYLLLILCKEGKYNPALELRTIDKKSLRMIAKKDIYGGLVDAGETDYWVTEFDEDFSKFAITHYRNKENWGPVDTLISHYAIEKNGLINPRSMD